LSSLPELPLKLEAIWCSFNQLTTLPRLPETISYFFCGNNQLECIPTIPSSVEFGDISENKLQCLPAKFDWLDARSLTLPICKLEETDCNQTKEVIENDEIIHFNFNKTLTKVDDFPSVSIYPNPTNDKIYIETSSKIESLKLSDIEGKEIKNSELNVNSSEIDLSDLINGVYFLQITIDSNKTLYKIIKTQ
jgi:hypothetical protein